MPWFDIIVLAILLTSAAVGFFSGATREMVRALSFVLAAVIAVFGLRWTAPIGRSLIEELHSHGHRVTRLVRREPKDRSEFR